MPRFRQRSILEEQPRDLRILLNNLLSLVWLPVSRRLPIQEEETSDYESWSRAREKERPIESVDESLAYLLRELVGFRLKIDIQISKQYKEFEKKVLESILYSKEHDSPSFKLSSFQEGDKAQLVTAFNAAGLLDRKMKERIDDHFEAAERASTEFRKWVETKEKGELPFNIYILPLIRRTKAMVQFARELEQEKKNLLRPLTKFQSIVSEFFKNKAVKIQDDGSLFIMLADGSEKEIKWQQLSSGEKQVLILLTNALLKENESIIYVADEPELSIHVFWQEKLLESIRDLGGEKIQLLIATHSPDIIGPFGDKVIHLEQLAR